MHGATLTAAMEALAAQFANRDWKYLDVPPGNRREKTYRWPGKTEENIMICVHKGTEIRE